MTEAETFPANLETPIVPLETSPPILTVSRADCYDCGSPADLGKLYLALAKARGEFKPIPKDKTGQTGHQKFQYAPLATIEACTTPALAKHELAVIQRFSCKDGQACITTELVHSSGAKLVSEFWFKPDQDIKKLGSQSTYFARYSYQRLLCVDSGEDADNSPDRQPSGVGETQPQQRTKPAQGRKSKSGVRRLEKHHPPSPPRQPSADELRRPEKSQTAPDVPEDVPTEDPETLNGAEEGESPPITEKTKKSLNELLIKCRFKPNMVIAECEKVAGRHPDQFGDPGGEALAKKMFSHFQDLAEKQGITV